MLDTRATMLLVGLVAIIATFIAATEAQVACAGPADCQFLNSFCFGYTCQLGQCIVNDTRCTTTTIDSTTFIGLTNYLTGTDDDDDDDTTTTTSPTAPSPPGSSPSSSPSSSSLDDEEVAALVILIVVGVVIVIIAAVVILVIIARRSWYVHHQNMSVIHEMHDVDVDRFLDDNDLVR